MDFRVTLTKRDNLGSELSKGTSVTMFIDSETRLMDHPSSLQILRQSLREIVKDGVDILIEPAKLMTSYYWQVEK